jgi:hypothetical protein
LLATRSAASISQSFWWQDDVLRFGIGLAEPDTAGIRAAGSEVLKAFGSGPGRLRIIVTAGYGPLGSQRVPGAQALGVAAGAGGHGPTSRVVRAAWDHNERSLCEGTGANVFVVPEGEPPFCVLDEVDRGEAHISSSPAVCATWRP